MHDFLILKLAPYILTLLNSTPQGTNIGVGLIDFSNNTYESVQFKNKKITPKNEETPLYYDLASLSKPLLVAGSYLNCAEEFDHNDLLLLNHRAGMPLGVSTTKENWKSVVSKLKITENQTSQYSDYSAIRLMLNLEKKNINLQELSHQWLDSEVMYWKNLPENAVCPKTGTRYSKPISCIVHDPIAYKLDTFLPHAGLFGTVDGISRTLMNLNSYYDLNQTMLKNIASAKSTDRFLQGFEINKNISSFPGGTGKLASNVFGHRGYTGTSFWINLDKNIGVVILTNTSSIETSSNLDKVKGYKHIIRQKITNFVWQNFPKTN